MKNQHISLALIGAVSLATGCGGGSGTTSTPPVSTPAPLEPVTFSISQTSKVATRRRDSLPPDAQSIVISLVQVPLPPPATPQPLQSVTINLTAGSSNCTSSAPGLICTGSMTVPAGQQNFSVTTYSQTGGNGSILTTGAFTQQVAASPSTVALSNANTDFSSVASRIAVAVSPTSLNVAAQQQPVSITLTAYDATGAIIIGPGSFAQGPIFVDIPDPDAFFPNRSTPLVATFTGPGPAQTLTYDQAALYSQAQGGSVVFTASGDSITPATATLNFLAAATLPPVQTPTPGPTLTPIPPCTPPPTPQPTPTPVPQFSVSPNTITFAGVAPQATQTFIASENGVASFTAQSLNTAIATVSGSGTAFTVTAGSTSGQTAIVVKDPSNREATVTVIVSGQTIIICPNSKQRRP